MLTSHHQACALSTNVSARLASVAAIALLAGLAAPSAMAQTCGNPAGCLVLSTSHHTTTTVNTTSATVNVTNNSTQIIGRLQGGTALYDQTVPVAFSAPAAQASVTAARAAITTAGGAGVIIGAPTLTASSSSTTSSVATREVSRQSVDDTRPAVVTFGPATVLVGDLDAGGTTVVLSSSESNINVHTETFLTINNLTTTTNTTTLFEQYTLTGVVQAVGSVHTAAQSGALDAGGHFLRRLGEESSRGGQTPIRAWAEGYGVSARQKARGGVPGDDRDSQGFAAGLQANLSPTVSIGGAIDFGKTDIDLDAAFAETGDIDLTQMGLTAGFGSGPWFANLAASYGVGDVYTTHAVGGVSTAKYDIYTTGALAEAGYRFAFAGLDVSPSIGADYTSVRSSSFSETGGLALTASGHTADRTRLWAGVELGQGAGPLAWSIYGRAVGTVSGEDRVLPASFFGAPVSITGQSEDDLGADAGARIAFQIFPGADLFARYDARFRDGFKAQAATAGVTVRF